MLVSRLPHAAVVAIGIALATLAGGPDQRASAAPYAWRAQSAPPAATDTLAGRIPPPPGFVRDALPPASFGAWLRGLPLAPAEAPVLLFTGAPKPRQDVHAAVVDIDIGSRDLQQCADAVMRLRAEWLFATGRKGEIAFDYTDGKRHRFGGGDHAALRRYMTGVFAYAGTYSLARELASVPGGDAAIGDVIVKGGFPGHAVLVADMVRHEKTGERRFLLLQSYMPAQSIHVLKNPRAADGSPWYPAPITFPLVTPEWTFAEGSLKRWR